MIRRLFFLLLALVVLGCSSPAAELEAPPALACQRAGVDAEACARGAEIFAHTFTAAEGLGEDHNDTSCKACHFAPVVGGAGGPSERVYSSAARYHGSTEQAFPMGQAYHVPPPLWSSADIEAHTADEIRAGCGVDEALGIRGVPSEKEDGLGRFGRHGEALTARAFNVGAIKHELGGCTKKNLEPSEHAQCAAGRTPLVTEAELDDLTAFVLGLEAPAPAPMPAAERSRGEALFQVAGCATCHTPARPERSDDCMHDMGPEDVDDQGDPRWRTAPLAGLRFQPAYGHDGRAATVEDAVELLHRGGEAKLSRQRFEFLGQENRAALLRFVEAL